MIGAPTSEAAAIGTAFRAGNALAVVEANAKASTPKPPAIYRFIELTFPLTPHTKAWSGGLSRRAEESIFEGVPA